MHPEADPAASNRHEPVPCPSCAYDLSGIIARWKHDGVDGGACSECGLNIEWSTLFSLSRLEKELEISRAGEFFEIGTDRLATRFWKTSWRAAVPTEMFPWITEQHAVRWPRLWAFLCVWLVIWLGIGVVPALLLLGLSSDPVVGGVLLGVFALQASAMLFVWFVSMLGVAIYTTERFRPNRPPRSHGHLVRTAVYAMCGLACFHSCVGIVQSGLMMIVLLVGSAHVGMAIVVVLGGLAQFGFALYLLGWSISWCEFCSTSYFRAVKADNAWLFPLICILLAVVAWSAWMAMK